MLTQKTSNRMRTALGVLLLSAAGLVSLWAASAPHRPPCRRGELLNHRTGMCYVPCDPTIPARTAPGCTN